MPPLISDFIAAAARQIEVTPADLLGPSRRRHLVHARWAVMLALRERRGLSQYTIARRLGRSDHSTVVHGLRAGRALRAVDPAFAAACAAVAGLT